MTVRHPIHFGALALFVICKPIVRRKAQIGDWVVGTGSKNSPIGNIGGKVVYAMKVTEKMTMQDYDSYTKRILPKKIPKIRSRDWRSKLGDSIYDFYASSPPKLRESVHTEENKARDLRGEYALLSKEFFYFGDKPQVLPNILKPIVKEGQGHKGPSNADYVDDFLKWLYGLGYRSCSLLGKPQIDVFKDEETRRGCALACVRQDEEDERLESKI